jgi:hypothetical protein
MLGDSRLGLSAIIGDVEIRQSSRSGLPPDVDPVLAEVGAERGGGQTIF